MKARTFTHRTVGAAALAISLAGSLPASTAHAADATAATGDGKWKVALGPGVVVTPESPGSRHTRVFPFPSLDISYDDRVFSQGPDVLGVNALRGTNYHVGAALSFDFQSRNENDDPHLHGLGNVHGGPKLKLFADYTVWMFTGSVALYQDIAAHGQGKTVPVDLLASVPVGSCLFSIGPGFTWADALYTRTFFGVSSQQSAASGLPVYRTGSGIRDVHLNGYISYDFSKHWVGSVAVTVGRLQHYAAASPITERRSELNTLASVNYRF